MRLLLLFAVLFAAFAAACSDDDDEPTATATATGTAYPEARVLLALARGGLGDRAFNDSAHAGLERAVEPYGITFETLDFVADGQAANLRQAVEQGYDLVVAIGSENAAPVKEVAADFGDVPFAVVDAATDGANVTSVTFRELEGDFAAGALTALLAPDGKVGFVGGADIPVIRRIEHGWREGVLSVNPDAVIEVRYIGGKDDFTGFSKPDVGKSMAAELYASGVTVVYGAAGGSTLGSIEAAKEAGKLIITTGSDQRYIAPEAVVTSRIKDMGSAIYGLVRDMREGVLKPGTVELDLKAGGVDLAPFAGPLVPDATVSRVEAILSELRTGKITVEPFVP